jgi:integrase
VAEKIRLTKKIIDLTPVPKSGVIFLYDSAGPAGLCLCVSHEGTRTWYLYRRIAGRPVRLKLGRYPDATVEAARKLAEEAAGKIAAGRDIQAEKKKTKRGLITWSDVFARFLNEHAKVHKKTWKEDQANDRRYLEDWSSQPFQSFTRQDIASKHREIGGTAPTSANRVLSLVSKVFNFAEEVGLWDRANPARKIKKYREQSRDRFVTADEMPALVKAIRAYPDPTLRDFFLICLATGARRANVLEMAWADIDPQLQTWRIPDTKSGEPVLLPLVPEAQKILSERKQISGDPPSSPFVFPGRGITGHLVEPKKAWKEVLTKAGLSGIKIHDLRRTLGSWQAAAGVSLPVIGKSLGHRTTTATAVYARLNLEPVRQAVSVAVAAMSLNAISAPEPEMKEPQDPGGKAAKKPIQKRPKKGS